MLTEAEDMRRNARISECKRYRYMLDRRWFEDRKYSAIRGSAPAPTTFVMLNPSTADAYSDDPTIRRCIGFTKREGSQWMRVVNLFAGRATKPDDLFKMEDPVGDLNRAEWQLTFELFDRLGGKIICAWGSNAKAKEQAKLFVAEAGSCDLHCLGLTKGGAPKHPLYIRADQPLIPYCGLAGKP